MNVSILIRKISQKWSITINNTMYITKDNLKSIDVNENSGFEIVTSRLKLTERCITYLTKQAEQDFQGSPIYEWFFKDVQVRENRITIQEQDKDKTYILPEYVQNLSVYMDVIIMKTKSFTITLWSDNFLEIEDLL